MKINISNNNLKKKGKEDCKSNGNNKKQRIAYMISIHDILTHFLLRGHGNELYDLIGS